VKVSSNAKIPGFPKPAVNGHAGELHLGHLGKAPVLVLSGRAHFYEGRETERVAFAVRAVRRQTDAVRRVPATAGGIPPDTKVFVADSDGLKNIRTFTVKELLPAAFTPAR
jgi:purine nucleoside phosphorylase